MGKWVNPIEIVVHLKVTRLGHWVNVDLIFTKNALGLAHFGQFFTNSSSHHDNKYIVKYTKNPTSFSKQNFFTARFSCQAK
jgi:hypothetical protein